MNCKIITGKRKQNNPKILQYKIKVEKDNGIIYVNYKGSDVFKDGIKYIFGKFSENKYSSGIKELEERGECKIYGAGSRIHLFKITDKIIMAELYSGCSIARHMIGLDEIYPEKIFNLLPKDL